ncbi:MAG: hypothetical protein H0V44_13920 [Planctomycetes bacterium]|nr:hypothetical protein [Planctomycetota bacterium]
MLTRYLFLVFGPAETHYWQAHHAILSVLAHAPEPREVLVVTTHPQRFSWLSQAIRIQPVDDATLTRWKGARGFFWRIKLECIRANAATDAAVVYCDSDILVRRDLSPLVAALAQGSVAMHEPEYLLSASRRRGDRALYRAVADKTFSSVQVDAATWMWNAGVVAVGPGQRELIETALEACDELCAATGNHNLAEQFALSISLAATGRNRPAREWIDHYWGNKPGFIASITEQQATILAEGMTIAQACAHVRDHPIHRPLRVRERWWQRWIQRRFGVQR